MSFELTLIMGYCAAVEGLPLLKKLPDGSFEGDGKFRYFEVKAIFELGSVDPDSEFSRAYTINTHTKAQSMTWPIGWFPPGAIDAHRPVIADKYGNYPDLIHASHLNHMLEVDTSGPRALSLAVAGLRGAHEMMRNYQRWHLLADFYGILYGH